MPPIRAKTAQGKEVILWMMNEVQNSGTEDQTANRDVDKFFNFRKYDKLTGNANRMKAHLWWKLRHSLLAELCKPESRRVVLTSRSSSGLSMRRALVKALTGRGRKRSAWVKYSHASLVAELESLSEAVVQMSASVLNKIALHALSDAMSPFPGNQLGEHSHKPIISHVTAPCIQSFLNRFNIVLW